MDFIPPFDLTKPWLLPKGNISVSSNILKDFQQPDIIVFDYLYQSFNKQLDGVILNEEEDFNHQLQVSSFLGAFKESEKSNFLILVLCPIDSLLKWHYYLIEYGKFAVEIITENNNSVVYETGKVLLLSFNNIKLVENLKECNFFSVVIDSFDEVATKLIIRKLKGSFNIGITKRNFYMEPDQRLQWTMLNWANLGIDNDNFANFRDNYKEWWFRITWNFCDSFVKPSLEDKGNEAKILRDWAKCNNLTTFANLQTDKKRTSKKRKSKLSCEDEDSEDEVTNVKKKGSNSKNIKNTKVVPTDINENIKNSKTDKTNFFERENDSDSNDTVIYEPSLDNFEREKLMQAVISNEGSKLDNFEREKLIPTVNTHEDSKCNTYGICDESDMFLKSVASSQHDSFALKNRKMSELFFKKILGNDEAESGSVYDSDAILKEHIDEDIASESDTYLKRFFSKENEDGSIKSEPEKEESTKVLDIDMLVAEVYEMVEKS